MKDDIYNQYNEVIQKQKNHEKEIRTKIQNYQDQIKKGINTISIENDIEKEIKNFISSINILEKGYNVRNAPGYLDDMELDRRQKEIQQLSISINNIEKDYNNLKEKKYSYKSSNEEYHPTEEMKDMSNEELLEFKDKKMKENDDKINLITNEVKTINVEVKEVGQIIKDQNNEMDKIAEDMDRVDSKFQKGVNKMKKYLEESSFWCIIPILVVEIVGSVLIFKYI